MIEAHDTFRLKLFFLELLKLAIMFPGPTGWGNACSGLLEKLIMRPEAFFKRIAGDRTYHSNEMRLNDAGLKMWWSVRPDGGFYCSIGGDQEKEYHGFVEAARMLILKRGLKWIPKRG